MTTTKRLTLPRRLQWQEQVAREAGRFNVLSLGRRAGKTVFGIDRLVTPETLSYPQAWFSPTYKMLVEVWRECTRIFAPITERQSAQERRIELITGGVIEFWSLDHPDVARGRKYRRIIVDEAAMVRQLMDAWQMVLRPTLADYAGDAFFLSTPKGMNGFHQMFVWGRDAAQDDWIAWQMPTSVNPRIAAVEIEAMRRTMPERVFQQEVMAQFLEDAGGVFRRVVDAATSVELERGLHGRQYVYGVDWGKKHDFTVIAVFDPQEGAMVALDRFNQIDYHIQLGRLSALCERFPPAAIVAEANSMGEPLIEQLQRQGLPVIPFTMSSASKMAIIDNLSLAFEKGAIQILNDPVLIGELQAYEMERLPSGNMRYSAPEGLHDDGVIATALGWFGASSEREPDMIVYDELVSISAY